MNEELVKSLTSLIDETIAEIEDLKKSRFAASEIKLAGPGEDGIKGHSADGKLDKEEDDKDDDDDKDMDKKEDDKKDKKDDKDGDDDGDMDKAEGHNRQADPNGGNHKPVAGEGDKHGQAPHGSPAGHSKGGNGKNREADPNGGNHKGAAQGGMDKSDGYPVDLKRSVEESNTLMKSYIDSKVAPLETKLAGILDLVKKIADQPVAAKGASAKNFAVLHKSGDEGKETLSKSQVANKLFELKKSGKYVDSADITAAELGSSDLQAIVTKYGLQ